jgi:hypothetical protein
VGEIIVGCNLRRGLIYDLGTEPGTSAEELPAAAEYQPRRITTSTQDDFSQPLVLPQAPPDAPF